MVFKPILFLFLYILTYYGFLFLFDGNSELLPNVSNILLTIANLFSLAIIFKAFTNKKNQNKPFTLLMLLGCLSYTLCNSYWAFYEYVYDTPPIVGFYDLLMLLTYLFFLSALIYYFKSNKVVLVSTYLFDLLIFTVITSTLSWVFIIRPYLIPSFDDYSLYMLITYLGYPIADLTLLFASLIVYLYTSMPRSILFIFLGFLINIVANSMNFYQSTIPTSLIGHWADPLWALTIILIGYSCLNHIEGDRINQRTYFKKYIQLFFPYSIMIIFLFVVYVNFYNVKDPLLIGVFISIVLLLIRLFNTINRNEALNKEINQTNLQLKEANDKLKFLAYHDELTNLPNRHLLFEKIQNEMKSNEYRNDGHAFLLFIDLDGFKAVNDTFGHTVGDELLKQVSNRLKSQLAENDFLCRFAGDEFIMLLTDRDKKSVENMATAIVESLSKQYMIDAHKVSISSSIGVSSFEEADSILSVINKADKAMYNIKKNGKNGFGFIM